MTIKKTLLAATVLASLALSGTVLAEVPLVPKAMARSCSKARC
ncbi:Uncharacterised protein [Serratia fonticola]|uniref:Uncharacterized protein n=1 Tax=Serratia fonticola TaxID=47917 RepID=A0A448SAB9_SERFO|nr:Uncharacterised protein [Serratia fonticola]